MCVVIFRATTKEAIVRDTFKIIVDKSKWNLKISGNPQKDKNKKWENKK
jgi:hypothetical protein